MPVLSKPSNFSPEIWTLIQKQTLKNFGYGFTLSAALSILSYIQNLFKRNKKQTDYKKYLMTALRSGTFLASWSIFYQVCIRTLELNMIRPNALWLATSGFASGFASMYLTQGISWNLSLYFFLRSLYSWFRIKLDKFPFWVQNFSPILLYCILNIGLGYMTQLNSCYVDRSYGEFLVHCAGFSRQSIEHMWSFKTLPDCKDVYHKEESCLEASYYRSKRILARILKIYVPFYFVSTFLKGSFFKMSLEKQKNTWISLLKNAGRSSLFLFIQCLFCGPGPCIHKFFTKEYNPFIIGILWFFASFAIYFENPSRVKEINIFTLWKLCVSFINYKMGVKENLEDGKGEQHSESFNFWASNLIFGVASSFSLYCLARNRQQLKSLDRTILVSLFPASLLK